MYKKIIPSKEILIILLLISGLILVRLYNIWDLFHFTYDESIFAFVGRRMFVGNHIPLIGGVTPFHVHLAPFFYWFSGMVLFLFGFNPIGWGFFTAFFSIFTAVTLYFLIREVYSKKVAFYSLFIYSFSLSTIIFDRHYWGIYFNPFLSIATILCLFKIVQKRYKFFIPLSIVLAFGFHTDSSTVVLLLLSAFIIVNSKIPLKYNKNFYLGLIIFLLSFLPLVIFDLRHDFVNILGFKQYIVEAGKSSGLDANRLVDSILILPQFNSRLIMINQQVDLAREYSYCPVYASNKLSSVPLSLVVLCILLYFVFFKLIRFKSQSEKEMRFILFSFIGFSALGIVLYAGLLGRPFFDHYLTTLIPVFTIIIAVSIDKLFGNIRIIVFVILLSFLFINLFGLKKLSHSFSLAIKNEAVRWALDNTSGDFSLDSLSSCFTYNGYRYLFTLEGREPTKSYVDQNFFWLYDKKPAISHPSTVVVFVASDYVNDNNLIARYNSYKENEIISQKFGNLEVIVADNTKEILYDF